MLLFECELQQSSLCEKGKHEGTLENLAEITSHYFPIHKMENKSLIVSFFI